MTLALRSLFLFCGLTGILTGVRSMPVKILKVKTENRPRTSQLPMTPNCYGDVSCPEGWTQLDCKCYIYQEEEREFADAEAVCNVLGGNLVSITSDLENAVVRALVTAGGGSATSAWIGYHDTVESENFMWTDGETSNYDNFASGQPISGSGDCIEMGSTQEWQNDFCSSEGAYVCIMEAGH